MSITTLYAELIVVGSGTMIFIVLLFYSLLGSPLWFGRLKELSSLESVIFSIPVLSVIYLLGIVIANVSHLLLEPLEEWLRTKRLGTEKKYEDIRIILYISPNMKDLVEEFEFRRSKVRICRGWFVNSILIIIALKTYLGTDKPSNSMAWFWIITVGLLMVGAGVSWWTATTTELKWFESFAKTKWFRSFAETQSTSPSPEGVAS
jgi:hypothetical protein